MKYIKFTVKPIIGNKEVIVCRKYCNDARRPPLEYTWRTRKGTITSSLTDRKTYYNYVRRGLTGWEEVVEALK